MREKRLGTSQHGDLPKGRRAKAEGDDRIKILARSPEQSLLKSQVILVACVSFGVYFNGLFNGFVFDDMHQVLRNPWIKNLSRIPEIFATDVWHFAGWASNYYRPLMHVSYMVSYYIFGLKAWGFHLVNLLYHCGVTVLVFLVASHLVRRFRDSPSTSHLSPPLIAALLFATHPIHTEVVTPIMGIPDLSFTFFYLLSFYVYIRGGEGFERGHILSVGSFFIATLCKEPALTLPLILLAYDYAFGRLSDSVFGCTKRYAPYLGVVGVYFVLRHFALGGFVPSKQEIGLSVYQYIINMFYLFALYLKKLIIPMNLNFLYTFQPVRSIFQMETALSLIVGIAFVFLMCVTAKKSKVIFFALLLIALPLLPALYLPALAQNLDNAFAERYLYLPSFGFVLLLAFLLARTKALKSPRPQIIMSIILLILTAFYSVGTACRNSIWKDNFSLWEDTAKKSPESGMARQYLAYALQERGKVDEAIEHYHAALCLGENKVPVQQFVRYNLGVAYGMKGETDKAIEEYGIALKLNPKHAKAHNNLAVALMNKGQIDQAIEHYRSAITIDPDFAEAHSNLGVAYAKDGLLDKAIDQFQIAVDLAPWNAKYYENLGLAYRTRGNHREAEELFRKARSLK